MRLRLLTTAAAALSLTLSLAACGDNKKDTASDNAKPTGEASASSSAATGTLARIQSAGKVVIGVKFDQPGVGEKDPATGELSGFDIEIAKIIAKALGITDDKDIDWKETVSANREPFIKAGTVDLVVASYSITDDRRKVVSQAGPYYETGQQLLVRGDDSSITGPESLSGKKVCSVTGSTSIDTVKTKYGAVAAPFSTYTECVQQLLNKSVDAVTTDGAILLGYAAQQPDKLKVVGQPFSQERYGVGFAYGDTQMCQVIRDALQAAFSDGSWAKAFADTLGKAGVPTPSVPTLDDHC